MNFCNGGGYLVGPDYWLPSERTDYFRASYGIASIGCNNLVCTRCGEPVQHTLAGAGRRYRCGCAEHEELGAVHLDTSGEGDPDPVPPWKCAGHATFVPPGTLAGVEIGQSLGWSPIVVDHIADPTNLHRTVDAIPGFVLTRIYQALDSEHDRRAVSVAVGARGSERSLRVRQAAVLFFALNGDAVGLERVLDAWRADPARYDDHPAGFGPHALLKDALLEATAIRIIGGAPGVETYLATWRWAALRGAGLGANLHMVKAFDADWAKDHVEEMLDLVPGDWHRIVRAIPLEFPMRLVPGLRRSIAQEPEARERIASMLTEMYGPKAEPVIAALA